MSTIRRSYSHKKRCTEYYNEVNVCGKFMRCCRIFANDYVLHELSIENPEKVFNCIFGAINKVYLQLIFVAQEIECVHICWIGVDDFKGNFTQWFLNFDVDIRLKYYNYYYFTLNFLNSNKKRTNSLCNAGKSKPQPRWERSNQFRQLLGVPIQSFA